ncbi:glycoside hydrolase family 6 protein [Frankia sp. QA3]|uniref:glycoside hydrolase family 6 protein n=1 Tax=Frankia sp. QA3 TaxID=710111 RepID=UPI000269B91A|nr:glycoside hydrolase family 6 protein [Frankia sp. QA3]EIV90610.1 cellobiohydrolase A (1,4-beta-cellobiosidase A) [Frankia sp. QA3]
MPTSRSRAAAPMPPGGDHAWPGRPRQAPAPHGPGRRARRPRACGRPRGVAAVLALAAALVVALVGCGPDDGKSPGGAGGAAGAATAVPAPDPTRCPEGGSAGSGPSLVADGDAAWGRAPRGPFLVDPHSQAAQQAQARPADAAAIAPLVQTSTAFPVGEWVKDLVGEVHSRAAAASAAGSTAVFMVYAIPHRDVGAGFSPGGLPDAASYRQFTRQVAAGIGGAAAVIVLEPDSLGQIDQLTAGEAAERYALLRDAVDVYGALPATSVYLDGANCGWIAPAVMARRLAEAGVAHARGFAVNVANYYRTEDEVARAEILSRYIGGAHYVVDTSRNGRGPAAGLTNGWCNPPGRGLGEKPTTSTGYPHADAFLWVKTPGASDGECGRGNPAAGKWWQEQAVELVRNAVD